MMCLTSENGIWRGGQFLASCHLSHGDAVEVLARLRHSPEESYERSLH